MKNLSLTRWCFSLALLCLVAEPVLAGPAYVVPTVPERAQGRRFPVPPKQGVLMVTTTADAGPGSLRQAIADAESGNTIIFRLKLPATIVLSNSLSIDKDLTILGPGPRLLSLVRKSGPNTPAFRVVHVESGEVTIAGLTISNGRAYNVLPLGDNLGGGIYNEGSLTVSNCVVTRNVALTEGVGYGFGAGIFTYGSLTVIDSTISGNTASFAGGGICTFHSAVVRLENSTISGNIAGLQGGGLNFQGLAGSLKNCTLSGNSTPFDGTASALLHIVFENEGASLDLTDCTIAQNFGNPIGAVVVAALPDNLGITTRLRGTLVAENDGANFILDGAPVLQSLGHNLDSDGSSGWVNSSNGDLVGTQSTPIDAALSPLQDNGGPTYTHALLMGSPAVDAGTCVDLDNASVPADQRHYPRPQGAACDIGAFENQPPRITCPSSKAQSCGDELTAVVFDPDGDALSVLWIVDGTTVATNYLNAVHPPQPRTATATVVLDKGSHGVTIRVSDGKAAPVECSTVVNARDSRPPRILSLKADPAVLTPANNQFVPVTIWVNAVDNCGPVQSKIISVHRADSDQSGPDWIITGDLTLMLRAERRPCKATRIYIITVESRDSAGNTTKGVVKVTVPNHED